jgi:hypothetical protein
MIMEPARSVSSESTPCWQRVITARFYTILTILSLTLVAGGAQAHPWSWGVCGWGTYAQASHCRSVCGAPYIAYSNPRYTPLVYACSERERQRAGSPGPASATNKGAKPTASPPKTPATAETSAPTSKKETSSQAKPQTPKEASSQAKVPSLKTGAERKSKYEKSVALKEESEPTNNAPSKPRAEASQKKPNLIRPQAAEACKDDMSNCGGGNSAIPPSTHPQVPWGLQNPNFQNQKQQQLTSPRPGYLLPNDTYGGIRSRPNLTSSGSPSIAPWLDAVGTALFGALAEAEVPTTSELSEQRRELDAAIRTDKENRDRERVRKQLGADPGNDYQVFPRERVQTAPPSNAPAQQDLESTPASNSFRESAVSVHTEFQQSSDTPRDLRDLDDPSHGMLGPTDNRLPVPPEPSWWTQQKWNTEQWAADKWNNFKENIKSLGHTLGDWFFN